MCGRFRGRLGCTMMDGQQGRWSSWWHADEFLEKAHMENIVETSVGRKLKAVGNVVDDGRHAVRPIEARPQLALSDAME